MPSSRHCNLNSHIWGCRLFVLSQGDSNLGAGGWKSWVGFSGKIFRQKKDIDVRCQWRRFWWPVCESPAQATPPLQVIYSNSLTNILWLLLLVVKLSNFVDMSNLDWMWGGTLSFVMNDLVMVWPLNLGLDMCHFAIGCSRHPKPTSLLLRQVSWVPTATCGKAPHIQYLVCNHFIAMCITKILNSIISIEYLGTW
jgi:hypothetical protein